MNTVIWLLLAVASTLSTPKLPHVIGLANPLQTTLPLQGLVPPVGSMPIRTRPPDDESDHVLVSSRHCHSSSSQVQIIA